MWASICLKFKYKNNKNKRNIIEQYIDYKCKMFDAIDPKHHPSDL